MADRNGGAPRPAPAEIVETVVVDHKPEAEAGAAVEPEPKGKSGASPAESKPGKPKVREHISHLEEENARLRRELEARPKTEDPKPMPTVPVNQQVKDWYEDNDPKHPMPKAPDATKFDDYNKLQEAEKQYAIDYGDWRAERTWAKKDFERSQDESRKAFEREAQQVGAEWQERYQASPHFDEIQALVGPDGPKKDLWLSQPMMDFIHTSEVGPDLLLHLCTDETEYSRVVAIRHTGKQIRAMQQLEAKFQTPEKTPAPKLVTRVPKPPTVLSGTGREPGAATSTAATSREEFERLRDQETKNRRRA